VILGNLYYNINNMFEIPFSIYLIIPSSIFILLVGFFVCVKSRKKDSLLFLFLALAQFLWSIAAFIIWQDVIFQNIEGGYILDKLLVLSVFLMPVFLYHFTVEFCKIKTSKLQFLLIYVISFCLFFIIEKETVVQGLFFYKWGLGGLVGGIHYLFSFFILVLLTLPFYNIFKIWKKNSRAGILKEILFWLFVLLLALGIFLVDLLPIYGINIYPLFYLTIPIYALIMAYVLINRKPLSSIANNDIFIIAILTFLSSFIVLPNITFSILERAIVFLLIATLSFLVLKCTNELSEQKMIFDRKIIAGTKELDFKNNELMQTKKHLEDANSLLENKVMERTKELQGLNDTLEKIIRDRTRELEKKTKELEEKIKELEDFGQVFVDRENKMIELKDRIRKLEEQK